jgi:hypothetical protein
MTLRFALLVLAIALPSRMARPQTPLDRDAASRAFAEIRDVVAADGGRLWGHSLDGPVLLVRREDRRVFASRPARGLAAIGDVFAGTLADSVGVANTSVAFGDTTWTMLLWPLPEDEVARRSLIAHELWHRVQGAVGFPSSGGDTEHLGTRDGRYWLRLEWRALSAALRSEGAVRKEAVGDALLFRAARHATFDTAAESERQLLMHEGLAEYTGWTLAGPTPAEARRRAAERLAAAESLDTFVRSFAYHSGPAWGLLLDSLDPEWRRAARPGRELGDLAAERTGWTPPADPMGPALDAARRYDGPALAAEEDRLETDRAVRKARQRVRYEDGPTLRLGFVRMNVSFDPGTVDVLEGVGRVYGSMSVRDEWGTLEVSGGGLILSDWSGAVVPAPGDPDARPIEGDGYVLRLADGWTLEPGERGGDWLVVRSVR